jgi:site-specific recombinase XerD
MVRVLDRVCALAGLTGVTPHVLRHTFASVAGNLNFSELTIKGLLGHAPRGVTQGYIHLDRALVVAAEEVSAEILSALAGQGATDQTLAQRRSQFLCGVNKQPQRPRIIRAVNAK